MHDKVKVGNIKLQGTRYSWKILPIGLKQRSKGKNKKKYMGGGLSSCLSDKLLILRHLGRIKFCIEADDILLVPVVGPAARKYNGNNSHWHLVSTARNPQSMTLSDLARSTMGLIHPSVKWSINIRNY